MIVFDRNRVKKMLKMRQ